MKRAVVIVLMVGFMIPGSVEGAEFAKVGTVGAQFLKIGVGARPVGMAGAYTAVADDATAIFWNPGCLTRVEQTSVFFAHTEWIADIRYEALGIAHRWEGLGVVGASFSLLTTGDMDVTTVEQQEGTGETFSASDMTIGASYATMLTDKFSVGGNVKYVREKFTDDHTAGAWGVDIGTLYYTGFRSLRMGMSIRNFGSELQPSGTFHDYDNGTLLDEEKDYSDYHMPMTFRFGLAMEVMESDAHLVTLAIDAEHPNDNVERLSFGSEYWLHDLLALRIGYIGRHDTAGLNAGAGFRLDMGGLGLVSFDYAYSDFGLLEAVHRASLTLDF